MSVLVTVLLLLAGCKEEGDEGPNCTELSELCHEADENGVEGAAECHDIFRKGVFLSRALLYKDDVHRMRNA